MSSVERDHPNESILIAAGLGQLNQEEFADVEGHLAQCPACCQVVEGVAPDTLLALLRSTATETDPVEGNGAAPALSRTALHTPSVSAAPETAPPAALAEHPRYRVGELLGVGGMGAVFKAEHLLMERPVALKVLNRELIDKQETMERFRREVRAAARLAHPNIVAAFDAEQAGDVHFLAMEFVEGVSLARRCAEYGPLPVAEACSYARQAALGLQHAHECGMVHRDIKPQNLMLTPGGQVKILDFGLARFIMESAPAGALLPPEGAGAIGADGKAKPLTQIGVVMGTPDYIAPEQAQDSHRADIRADIYSLGCTLYDMLAGHAPFPDGNAVQKVKAHLHRTPPPLKTLRRDVPVQLVRVIERMMAKDPAQRYQTPAAVAAALAPFTATTPPRRKKWPLVAAALGLAAVLIAAAVIYVQTDRGRIVIETNDDKIAVMIEKAGGVKIVDQANKREYRLQPGERDLPTGDYKIEVTEALAGLDFQVKRFELKRGKAVRLSARFAANDDGQAKMPDRGVNRERAKERLRILKEIAAQQDVMFQVGKATMDTLLKAKREVAKAELELCESDQERINVHETLVALSRDLVKILEAQSRAGMIQQVDVLQARADLLEAENALERAKTRQPSADRGPLYGGKPASFWLEQLKDANPNFRAEAIEALGHIAQKDKNLIPVVLASLNDTYNVSLSAASALMNVGPDVVPPLLEAMKHEPSPIGICHAAGVISHFGPKAKAAIPFLIQVLRTKPGQIPAHEGYSTWYPAVSALGSIGPDAKPAIPAMIDVFGAVIKSENSVVSATQSRGLVHVQFSSDIPASIYRALKQIDPQFKDSPPSDTAPAKTLKEGKQAVLAAWEKAYENLRKRYPARPDEGAKAPPQAESAKEQSPLYRGRPAAFWLEQFKDADPKFRGEALEALGMIARKDKRLIPVVADALRDTPGVSGVAANMLGALGADAVPAILQVIKEDRSPIVVIHAAGALRRIGPSAKAAVPFLIDVLRAKNALDPAGPEASLSTWTEAIRALGAIGPGAKPAIPAIVDAFGAAIKADFTIQQWSAAGQGPPVYSVRLVANILNPFYPALRQIDPEFKDTPPSDLGSGKTWDEAKEALRSQWQKAYERLKSRYPVRLDEGAGAVPGKQAEASKDQGALYAGKPASFWLNQLEDANPKFRVEAVEALEALARKNKKLIQVLSDALKDKDNAVASAASDALGVLGSDAVPALINVLKDRTVPAAHSYAAYALGRIGPGAKGAVPLLAELVTRDKAIQRSAITALGRIGPEARRALPAMIEALGDYLKTLMLPAKSLGPLSHKTNVELFQSRGAFLVILGEAFSKIDPEIQDQLPKYVMENPIANPRVMVARWQQAYDALKGKYPRHAPAPLPNNQPEEGGSGDTAAKSGLDGKDQGPSYRGQPVSYWMSQFKDADPKFRIEAVQALGFFAAKDKEMVPLLVAYLKDKDTTVARQASRTLGSLETKGLPLLLDLLKDRTSAPTVTRAAEAVGWIGPKGKDAVPLLAQALKMDDPDVRSHCILALGRIGPEAKSALPEIIDVLGAFLDSVAEQEKKVRQENRPVFASASNEAFVSTIRMALVAIDPAIQTMLPMMESPHNPDYPLDRAQWQKAHDALKSKYGTGQQ
jgi:HEAT repeat protein